MTILAAIALVLALLPCLLFWRNLALYRPVVARPQAEPVSILIPARNEAASIRAAVVAALATEGVPIEVIVLDDHSTDTTAAIVLELAAADPRVELAFAPELPAGWCGKQHACYTLAQFARHDLLLFLDADVRLTTTGVAQAVTFLHQSNAALVSGVPRQETGALLEQLLIPLIHFVLLGFLPLDRMRRDVSPSLGAGCGQFFLARRAAYDAIDGHATVKASLHDGLKLPRAFRAAGYMTDLFDATSAATCRMYRTSAEVWRGLAKNATEGLAAPGMIVPATVLLAGGQILPLVLAVIGVLYGASLLAWTLIVTALAASYSIRLASAVRFRQSLGGALLHPLAIGLFLALQWHALLRLLAGRPAQWKERAYNSALATRS